MDILKLIQEKEAEFADLYSRMDTDRSAVHLDKYTLTGFDQFKNKELPRTVSVTMNKPAVFHDSVKAVLLSAKRQTVVEGPSDSQAHKIENFLDDCFYTADERLRARRISGLWAWMVSHVTIRGPIGCRWTFEPNGRPNCLPVDMRYCPFEDDSDGLAWAANHTRRRGRALRAEYGQLAEIPEDGKDIDVYDYWDAKQNIIFINDVKVIEQPNPYGRVPFVIQFPACGDYLLDQGYQKYWAESIFFLVRDLYPEWNRLMSIQQTLALKIVKPPYVYEAKDITGAPQSYPDEIAKITPVLEGETPQLLQMQDMSRAFQQAETSMGGAIHEGSPSITDLADTAGTRNASWVAEQTEIRDKITVPRTQALEQFYQQLALLVIKEYQAMSFKKPVPLGRAADRRIYQPSDLGDPENYTIEFRYMPDNKRQKLANYTVALAMKGTLSRDTILRDIIQCDDPDGEIDKLALEEAEQSNPIIFYYNKSARMIDVAKTQTGEEKKRTLRKARITADSMVQAIKQAKMAQGGQPQGTANLQLPAGKSQGLVALPGIMGGGSRSAGGNNGQR